jgi:AraC-like DNA-binding protein
MKQTRVRLPPISVVRTFAGEANRLSAGIIRSNRANRRAVDRVFNAYHIAYLLDGSGHYIGPTGVTCELQPGDLVQRFPARKHTLIRAADGRWLEFYLVLPETLFRGLAGLGVLDARREVLHPGVDDERVERISQFLRWLRDHIETDPGAALLESQRLLFELLEHDRARRGRDPDAVAMDHASFALRQGLDKRLDMADVARSCGLGYEKFRKLFTRTYGTPPKQYRLRHRIDVAKRLLVERKLGIKEIAFALGYSEVANFANQFKHVTGVSPGAYRERH